MSSESHHLRPLRVFDIPDAMVLKEIAGWNQTEEDWKLFIEIQREGCFALEAGGRVVATSTAIPYGSAFGWVGMVLVLPEERRKGHGTRMLDAAVEHLLQRGVTPALDATQVGKLVYDRRGFVDVLGVERRMGMPAAVGSAAASCGRLAVEAIDRVADLDREAFGADRTSVLRGLLGRDGSRGLVYPPAGEAEGYLIVRRGTRFTHIGPWVARSEEAASALFATALSRLQGCTVGVDTMVPNAFARRLAESAGLPVVRSLVRMARPIAGGVDASCPPGGRPDRIFALAGFAWG
ncbi:MAG: GNAT family N-acetyltransferase [Planctomycetes bacterium]|nr:GNAT family N-acetyltransferase [Planctomycetota bacterium]